MERQMHPRQALLPGNLSLNAVYNSQLCYTSQTEQRLQETDIHNMQRAILILTLVGGILAAPLLCGAGVTAHECICDSTACCAEETTCEPDPCSDVYKEGRQKHLPMADTAQVSLLVGVEVSPAMESPRVMFAQETGGNKPFPDSDLPLLI